MDDVVLCRHGESVTAAAGVVGGDAPLTATGREQARALGRELSSFPFDVCIASGAIRARETASLALAGRDVPCEIDEAFGDIDFGAFAGGALDRYREWIASHAPTDAPPGGESRVATLRRFGRAYRSLLARSERHVLVVAHGLTLTALTEERPRPVVAGVPYGSWLKLGAEDLEARLARLERWCDAPAW
ncbi:MAG TPA: histidine phosphatase family protein [Gaiellaceae bacterium]|nr:histidine phosphatase family protein [Gaiellaceae bacterium]